MKHTAFHISVGKKAWKLSFLTPFVVHFSLRFLAGNVYVNDQLDAERKKFYVMTILAEDSNGASYAAQMKVSVLDVNDNKPKFASNSYKISIPTDILLGTMVLQVIIIFCFINLFVCENYKTCVLKVFADDADEDDVVEYSIRKDSDGDLAEKYFKLNPQNGKLETKRDLRDYCTFFC